MSQNLDSQSCYAPEMVQQKQQVTVRSVVVGLIVGTLMCMSNMYFGLQTGWISMGSLQSAILGFGIFNVMQKFGFGKGFSMAENVVVQSTSVATATMPLAAGFVGVIPAMAMLSPDQNPPDGPYNFGTGHLIIWSVMLAFFGVFVAVPLRSQVIEREQLRFPSGLATANVIRVLHGGTATVDDAVIPSAPGGIASSSVVSRRSRRTSRRSDKGFSWQVRSVEEPLDRGCCLPTSSLNSEVEMVLTPPRDLGGHSSSSLGAGQGGPPNESKSTCVVVPESSTVCSPHTQQMQFLDAASRNESMSSLQEVDAGLDLSTMQKTWSALANSFSIAFVVTTVATVLETFGKSDSDTEHHSPMQIMRLYAHILTAIPFLGSSAARWGWTLGPYMGYVGQGMIMGPQITASMFAGAVLAFGILGPWAVSQGLAPSHHGGNDGSGAWLTWIALAIMIADSMTSLLLLVVKWAWKALQHHVPTQQYTPLSDRTTGSRALDRVPDDQDHSGEPGVHIFQPVSDVSPFESSSVSPVTTQKLPNGDIPVLWWGMGLLAASVSATAVFSVMFDMPIFEVVMSIMLALLVAILAVRALGETDLNPVSGIGKLSQVTFAIFFPGRVLQNLVAGAVSEAAAQQAGDMMQDFKTAHLLRVCPRAQFIAMAIGSFASCFISTAAYALYSSVYDIGGEKLPAPSAQIWLYMATLVNGGHLPDGVKLFCYLGGVFGFILALAPDGISILQDRLPKESTTHKVLTTIQPYIPSGIGFSIGMYIPPAFTIPRVIGSVWEQVWLRQSVRSHKTSMLITASGLVLGEGIASMIATIIKSFL